MPKAILKLSVSIFAMFETTGDCEEEGGFHRLSFSGLFLIFLYKYKKEPIMS